ncbi:conjugal transfer protein TraG N-terminal domain-containing protein [Vibrio casei]|uniref:Conjugal transfer protein TraG n=1 Tax=Vibrio casei TaxID=673372 RepID=A0A368LFX1_9VIBR|nr:conjugal transfer protein TraG N-terminal domain-containing protein [Vibrio casei]RCS68699.1 conjugal transfer protein TraG [Vibrio casei]SJN15632.1 IncF plasmid conjugative transfer protein TraG [Vibrio casei]
MFEIYSTGDAAFLEQILMAVAMVTSMASFEKMVSVGLLLGVILIFVQSVFQGAKEINYHQIFVGYILYAAFFIPTTTVVIEDSFSGQVRVVDNVPIGVGAAGGIISSIGYNITSLFEQGYGVIVPYVTETHFAESLQIINNTRRGVSSTPVYTAMNMATGGDADMRLSWNNYIRECALTAIDLKEKSLDSIMSQKLPDALRFNSDLYGTRLYVGTAGGEDYTCSEAYPLLVSKTTQAINSAPMSDAILNVLGIDNTYTGSSGQAYVTNSLGVLGVTATAGTEYLTAAVLEPIYYEAAQGRYADFQDMASATMINQAIQQRNTQWAAEQSMFLTIVRPMMTFFEGFVYAITPLMGFLIVLGSFGIGLAAKYFQTLLWIQLWMPVMSIINLYIHTAANKEMSSLGSDFTSIYALNAGADQLQHWIATGGMLAAATPIISLFVVTGSTYALTSLAGRISGKDHIDEKIQSKDLVSNGPIAQAASSNEYSDLTGMASSGAAGLMGSISFGSGLSNMTTSAKQNMTQAQNSFAQSLGTNFSSGTMSNESYDKAASIGRTHSAMHGTSEGIVNERANQIMENTSIGTQHSDAVKGVVSAVATGAISAKAGTTLLEQIANSNTEGESETQVTKQKPSPNASPDAKASRTQSRSENNTSGKSKSGKVAADVGGDIKISAGANKETSDARTTAAGQSNAISDALRFSQQEQSQVSNNLARAISTGSGQSLSKSLGKNEAMALTEASQNLNSTSNSFSEAMSLNNQFGSLNNLRLRDVGSQVAGNNEAMSDLNDYWNSGGVSAETKQEAQQLYERYSAPSTEGGYGLDNNSALAAARIKALQNSNNHEGTNDTQYQNNFNAALGAVGKSLGLATGNAGGYNDNSGIEKTVNNGLTGKVTAATKGVESATAPANGIVIPENGYPTHSDPVSSRNAPPAITSEADENSSTIANQAADWQTERNQAAEMPARQTLMNNGPEYSRMGAAEFYGGVENAAGWVGRRMEEAHNFGESVFKAGSDGLTVASANFDQRVNDMENNPELRKEVMQAARMDDAALEASGFGGSVLSGLSTAGRSIMGAAAAGMELVNGDIGFSDLKNMSLEEKGMVYQSAMSHAYDTGGDAAVKAFQENYGTDFRSDFYDEARSRGLNDEQAQVYAHSFDQNTFSDSPEREAAIQNLASTYAERDDNGVIMRDETGAPVLSEQNQEFVDHLTDTITESARAGSELSGAYLGGIAHYNNSTGRNGTGVM